MARVAFLWHMHQPYYEDLVTREHIMPWVRLHALKDYYGMVTLLEEFPRMKATFNLVPSLLVQLEAFAENRAHDRYLDVGLKPADGLSRDDAGFMLQHFFHAQRERMIETNPRYAELLSQRGPALGPSDFDAALRRFTVDDLRDLQVWQKLAWLDPYYLEEESRTRDLLDKGRGFTEEDKQVLRDIELEILGKVIPAYRARAEAGQIEISTSPFYHPILPLLCDTDIYLRTHPESRMPRHRFVRPEDAAEQLSRAAACHERLFGRRPIGLWPSEGSVSDAMVPIVAAAGFQWMATDELILARTLGTAFVRDGSGRVDQPERLYAPYTIDVGGATVACGFRDHGLSDQIGFQYANWAPETAADDFVTRLADAGRRASTAGGEEPTIFVILDGENAWEHFEGGGRPFLRALYGRLCDHPELRTVTMAEACRSPSRSLTGIFPGSWIDANFYIWIGHADDHRAWSQLAEARDALDSVQRVQGVDPATLSRAREELFIAEGSDWFWWYGDDHSSDHDAEFDDLYRRHLRNVYRLLGQPVPDELFLTNISTGVVGPVQIDPVRLISPVVDGEVSSYFEWLGAGEVGVRDVAGAMHEIDRRSTTLVGVWWGFDRETLYVRIDASRPAAILLGEGASLGLGFVQPPGLVLMVHKTDGATTGSLLIRGKAGHTRGAFTGSVAAGDVFECAIPFHDLQLINGQALAFRVSLALSGVTAELDRPIEDRVPDAEFTARHWSA